MQRREILKAMLATALTCFATQTTGQETIRGLTLEDLMDAISSRCWQIPYTRKSIYALYNASPTHPVIEAYRKGVGAMKTRSSTNRYDPLGWTYQHYIHQVEFPPPSSLPSDPLFNTCPHQEWLTSPQPPYFFLAWHRMFLYFFERIVRQESGYPDFALPYWDYGPPNQRKLPPPFQGSSGTTDPLYNATRLAAMNNGLGELLDTSVDNTNWLAQTDYFDFQRALEFRPHNFVHGDMGGDMATVPNAARDPIFWLHHSNIDRLWEKWLQQPGRVNPTFDSSWMAKEYSFVNENKSTVKMTAAQVLILGLQLNYEYDDPASCIIPRVPDEPEFRVAASAISTRGSLMNSILIAKDVTIKPEQSRIELLSDNPEARQQLAEILSSGALARAVEDRRRFILTLEGVRTEEPMSGHFDVYIGLPTNAEPNSSGPNYAGSFSTWGADKMSRESMSGTNSHRHGINVELDVTDALIRTAARQEDASEGLKVTLVPAGVTEPGARFTIDSEVKPHIDAVVLNVIRR